MSPRRGVSLSRTLPCRPDTLLEALAPLDYRYRYYMTRLSVSRATGPRLSAYRAGILLGPRISRSTEGLIPLRPVDSKTHGCLCR